MCVEDAVVAPVGQHCIDCVRAASAAVPGLPTGRTPATRVALGAILVVAVIALVDRDALFARFGLVPLLVGRGEWWRLLTGSLLHAGLLHLGFNALLLWRLGEGLERMLGSARAAVLIAAGAAGGSLGVVAMAWITVVTPLPAIPLVGPLLATSPASLTVGASGAVFGLMGATMAHQREAGIDPWRTDIGSLVALNLVLTFVVPAISIGGHVGGLAAGFAAGSMLAGVPRTDTDRRRRTLWAAIALAVASFVAARWLAAATLTALMP
jgi:membrane associated rhomboid family serine protease